MKSKPEQKDYEIVPDLLISGLFTMKNIKTGAIYGVDIGNPPFCSCEAFKYGKKNKKGNKPDCNHIKICKGIV